MDAEFKLNLLNFDTFFIIYVIIFLGENMSKVLILTAERTGTGHKASANAIEKKLIALGFETKQVDCFETMGKTGIKMENSYIPLTTKHPYIWKLAHGFSQWFSDIMHEYIYNCSKKEMLKIILDYKPDLIISVHCMFTKAVSKLLRKNKLNIPFMINVIDLINPPRVWRDKHADHTFVPTKEVLNQYIKLGFDPNKVSISGFPIREDIIRRSEPKKIDDKLNILLLNPSINLKKNLAYMREVSSIENANVKIVCGRDKPMFEALTKEKESSDKYNNVEIFGFVTNINELLVWAHVLLSKAGPNAILEGTRSGTAVVVTGHIPGQEAHNYEYITKNGYGIKCENPKKIRGEIESMIKTGEINKYFTNTLKSECNDGAKIIAEKIEEYLKNNKN